MFAALRSPPSTRASIEGTDKTKEMSPATTSTAPPAMDGFVRRRSGELESLTTAACSPPTTAAAARQPAKPTTRAKPSTAFTIPASSCTASRAKVPTAVDGPKRLVEARAKVRETKKRMDEFIHMKRDVKVIINECLDFLLRLIIDLDSDKEQGQKNAVVKDVECEKNIECKRTLEVSEDRMKEERKMMELIESHSRLLKENQDEMEKLKEVLVEHQVGIKKSYASVTAAPPKGRPMGGTTVHSIVVSSKDESETGEQVLEKIRVSVNAREEGTKIEKVRKAKDRKIIIGCGTREEIGRVKDRLMNAGKNLNVEEIKNKEPLVMLRDVLKCNSDEEVLAGIRSQNKQLFLAISQEDDRMEVKFRKRARNSLTEHIVLKTSPKVWKRLTESGAVHIDLQKVRVEDQSPLIQCSRCLGYGHGKRFCRDPVDVCSHCGGPHLGSMCTARQEGVLPRCVNCVGAKFEHVDHNAFSEDCPVRRRWDALARATVQYC